jgi:predicted transcriptional regulator
MGERLASVRLRSSLHDKLRLLAADLSRKRQVRITIRSVLEEGVRELFGVPLSEWVQWASESVASFDELAANDPLKSDSFRIDADLVRELGVLAAQISLHSKVPITKAHLIEEAGQRIIAQVEAEQQEVNESIQSTRPLR